MKAQFVTTFSYSLVTEAKDEEEAENLAGLEYERLCPRLEELNIKTESN